MKPAVKSTNTMRKVRGRRIVWLLASALPLLAKDDIPVVSSAVDLADGTIETTTNDQEQHGVILEDVDTSADDSNSNGENDSLTFQSHLPQHHVVNVNVNEPPKSLDKSLRPSTSQTDDDWKLFPLDDSWSDEIGCLRYYNTVIPLRPFDEDEDILSAVGPVFGNVTRKSQKRRHGRYALERNTSRSERIRQDQIEQDADAGSVPVLLLETTNSSLIALESSSSTENTGNETIPVENATDAAATVNNITQTTTEETPTEAEEVAEEAVSNTDEHKDGELPVQRVVVDYASKSAGALILEKSLEFQGASNLLNNDKDQYAIVPCQQPSKFVIVGLSEDILVKQVVLANYERYSSQIKEFKILGSQTVGHWVDLGTYQADAVAGKQTFALKEPSWARYLKFRFISHFGDEHYCTISQISVHGSTMVQGFHEQWEEAEAEEEAVDDSTDGISITIIAPESSVPETPQPLADAAVILAITTDGAVGDIEKAVGADESAASIVQCVTKLNSNSTCLSESSFEKEMFLFGSSNVSDFALSLASTRLTCRQSVKSNSLFTLVELDRTAIVKTSRMSPDANLSEKAASTGPLRLPDSSIVHRTKNMIKATADIEVILDNAMMGNRLSSKTSSQVVAEDGAEKINRTSATFVSESSVKEEKKLEATPPLPPVLPKVVSPNAIPETPPAPVVEMPDTKAPAHEKKADTAHEALHESGLALANVLERLPSAACIGELDFAKFKAKIMSARASNSGSGGQAAAGGAVEPIFKKLADEIRTLQTSVSVHDQFAKSSIACYQRVMLDLVVELEAIRVQQDARISRIEQELLRGTQWTAVFQGFFPSGVYGVTPTLELLVSSLISRECNIFCSCLGWSFCVCLAFFVCRVITSAGRSFCEFLAFFICRVITSAGSRKRKLSPLRVVAVSKAKDDVK